jgi:hypothetical protein
MDHACVRVCRVLAPKEVGPGGGGAHRERRARGMHEPRVFRNASRGVPTTNDEFWS